MKKKFLKYICEEVKKGSVVFSVIEPTLEECDYLCNNGISVIKGEGKTLYLMDNQIVFLDTIIFTEENRFWFDINKKLAYCYANFFIFGGVGFYLCYNFFEIIYIMNIFASNYFSPVLIIASIFS